ncbi:MAG: PaaI family thioesterase [Proteobacteria bacterium]|nr:PaaI family thioesterase [Pseudomonadota bacterium]
MEILRQLRDEGRAGDVQALLDHIPYARFMGFRAEVEGDTVTTIMPFKDSLIGNVSLPALHGGTIGALLEVTSVMQLLFDTQCERLPRTVDISVDYLRSGYPVDTYGQAIVTRQGRRVANVRAEIWQTSRDRLIATSHGHFLLTPV